MTTMAAATMQYDDGGSDGAQVGDDDSSKADGHDEAPFLRTGGAEVQRCEL